MACTIRFLGIRRIAPTAPWLVWSLLAVACGGAVGIDNVESDSGTGGVENEPGTSSGGSNQIELQGGTGGVEQSKPGGGSGGSAAGGGATVEPCGTLIDDMEDRSGRICTREGRIGVWYAFNDGTGTQWPEPTTPGVPILPSPVEGGRDGSYAAMHTWGDGFQCGYGWGAGIGVDLNFDGITYGTYNASGYEGISFWARSGLDDGSDVFVRINTTATTSVEYGGTCVWEVEEDGTCNGAFAVVSLSKTWEFYELPFAGPVLLGSAPGFFHPPDQSQLTSIQFFGTTGATLYCIDDGAFDFWIDDLRFY